jgi:CRP-like cAMP-binding protein
MPTTMMRISVDHFRKILDRYPSLQMSFTRLLVRRMAEINRARSDRYASGLAGKLSEMPPPDLFQTFNINQKTGVLTLKLPQKKTAQLSFRDGKLVDVEYDGRQGEDAFFELLKLKEGHFKYFPGLSPEKMQASEIGDFMYLIIEGLRRIEQDDRDFLRTVIPTLV